MVDRVVGGIAAARGAGVLAGAAGSASAGASLQHMLRGAGLPADDPALLTNAQQIWEFLDDLQRRDPAAYADFLRKQMAEGSEALAQEAAEKRFGKGKGFFPSPGAAVKLQTRGPSGPQRPTFINLVTSKAVQPPMLPSGVPAVNGRTDEEHSDARALLLQRRLEVPLHLSFPRATRTNSGDPALVVDIVTHPWILQVADADASFREDLLKLATSSVLTELGWIAVDTPTEIRAKYKGGFSFSAGSTTGAKKTLPAKCFVDKSDAPAPATHAWCEPPADEVVEPATAASTTTAASPAAVASRTDLGSPMDVVRAARAGDDDSFLSEPRSSSSSSSSSGPSVLHPSLSTTATAAAVPRRAPLIQEVATTDGSSGLASSTAEVVVDAASSCVVVTFDLPLSVDRSSLALEAEATGRVRLRIPPESTLEVVVTADQMRAALSGGDAGAGFILQADAAAAKFRSRPTPTLSVRIPVVQALR